MENDAPAQETFKLDAAQLLTLSSVDAAANAARHAATKEACRASVVILIKRANELIDLLGE